MDKAHSRATAGKGALQIVHYFPQFAGVKKVVDAAEDVVVEITKQDCRQGKTMALDSCALVKALQREHDGAIVSKSVAYLIDGKIARRYRVGIDVYREIIAFDRTRSFAPGVYVLRSPSPGKSLQPLGRELKNQKPRGLYPRNKKRLIKTRGVRTLTT